VKAKRTKEPFDPKLGVAAFIQDTALKPPYSISLYAGSGTADGVRGDHILIAPPYNTTREEIELIARLTQRVVEDVFANLAL
jgi:adenosylmethionine-8-amino-7-oxononanoate aminotransferase